MVYLLNMVIFHGYVKLPEGSCCISLLQILSSPLAISTDGQEIGGLFTHQMRMQSLAVQISICWLLALQFGTPKLMLFPATTLLPLQFCMNIWHVFSPI